jgi:hypothetical protein
MTTLLPELPMAVSYQRSAVSHQLSAISYQPFTHPASHHTTAGPGYPNSLRRLPDMWQARTNLDSWNTTQQARVGFSARKGDRAS